MKLILIRHGETEEGKQGKILGHLHGELTAKGLEYAENVGCALQKLSKQPDLIFSSDLQRAADTAQIISKKIKATMQFDKLLRERKGGVVEGKAEKEINWESYEKIALPYRKHVGGESFRDVKKRAIAFLDKIEKEKYSTVVIVSHNVFLSMILAVVLKWTYAKTLKFDFDDRITVIDTKKTGVEKIPLLCDK